MRFAAPEWLIGASFALLVAAVLIIQGVRLARDKRRFGDPDLVDRLTTSNSSIRRAVRGTLVTLALAVSALAAAGPQYGKGTRVLPATNLDVVLAIDYSKSMFARDVSPSRIERAKVEVSRLINELPGARFGAVAFAGETMSFPLTSDGASIAQFFRSLSPSDMPVGGTGIARALYASRELLARDPLSARHERVIVLVTDGEDLEGDPVAAAKDITSAGIRLDVVQIGGRSPEPIPDIDGDGRDRGFRRDSRGQVLTTALSPEGEAELTSMAEIGGGQLVRAEKGQVGISVITDRLRTLMTEELSERVETVYADVYHLPLICVVVLLLLETFIGLAKKRTLKKDPPPGKPPQRKLRRMQKVAVLLATLQLGCEPYDAIFERESPLVNEAIAALSAGDKDRATELLIDYLETGPCEESVIGAGERARKLGDASLDLALALAGAFPATSAESKEDTAGDEPPSAGDPTNAAVSPGTSVPKAGLSNTPSNTPPNPLGGATSPGAAGVSPERDLSSLECALRLLSPVAENRELLTELRSRALYLMGNLELSRGGFDEAVAHYDRALLLAPGSPESDEAATQSTQADPVGILIAHNRALALRLKEAKEQQEEQQKNEDDQEQPEKDSEQDKQESQNNEDDQEQPEKDSEQDSQDDESSEHDQEQPEKDSEQDKQESKGSDSDGKDEEQDSSSPGKPPTADQASQDAQAKDADAQPSDQPPPARPSASQDSRILDRLEQAPTLQQHDAKKRAGVVGGRPTMEDK